MAVHFHPFVRHLGLTNAKEVHCASIHQSSLMPQKKGRGKSVPTTQPERSEPDPYRVEASPAKRLFLGVLTRDIQRARAILDLVDNSVDGAIRLRGTPLPDLVVHKSNEKARYEGLEISVRCTPTEFGIVDNCGGIPLDVARYYAFRFGHDNSKEELEHKPTQGSRIGIFGIGMKRALFKLGSKFRVESTTKASRFVLELDAETWLKQSDWTMRFIELDETKRKPTDPAIGTRINVTSLHQAVQQDFGRPEHGSELLKEIQLALQEFIRRGLTVNVTAGKPPMKSVKALATEPKLKSGAEISPYVEFFTIPGEETNGGGKRADVNVRIFAGVGEQSLADAGWYVFCNGRLIEGPGQTDVTGWGVEEPAKIPQYHNQFDRFYGYVYMDCDDPERLPWNSTKTGLAEDNELYRGVRQKMILAMRPVIDMLNRRRREEKLPAEARTIAASLSRAESKPLTELKTSAAFKYPAPMTLSPDHVTVSFIRPATDIEFAKQFFKVKKGNTAAERAFESWLRLNRET